VLSWYCKVEVGFLASVAVGYGPVRIPADVDRDDKILRFLLARLA
jgi:hypothetical protein